MFSKWVLTVLCLAHCVCNVSAIECPYHGHPSRNSTCSGDYCVKERVQGNWVKSDQRCVSGYPNLESGCYNVFLDVFTCFCNSSELCNSSDLLKSSKNLTTPLLECHQATISDDKLSPFLDRTTCSGTTCYMSQTLRGTHTSGLLGCSKDVHVLRWFKGAYCAVSAERSKETGLIQLTRYCTCDSKMCNNLTLFEKPNKPSNVVCESGVLPLNSTSEKRASTSCMGDYCYARNAWIGEPAIETGCVDLLEGDKLVKDKYEHFNGDKVHFCKEHHCNLDIKKWFQEIHED